MAKYAYPAIFTEEDNGSYSVRFPDVEGCYTCGDDLPHAMEMASDALGTMMTYYEDEKINVPDVSAPGTFQLEDNEFANYIACDTLEYRKKNSSRAVKKTLSIPEWLNEMATEKGLNFSQILQEALKAQLGL